MIYDYLIINTDWSSHILKAIPNLHSAEYMLHFKYVLNVRVAQAPRSTGTLYGCTKPS